MKTENLFFPKKTKSIDYKYLVWALKKAKWFSMFSHKPATTLKWVFISSFVLKGRFM